MTGGGPTLLCTDTVVERFGDRIALAAPGLDIVTLRGRDALPDDELERVELAFFSGDTYPERSALFMGTAVRTPNLRWLHTFSAGTDHPIFTSLRDRGVRVTTSSGASATPIARTVMMYLLALSRDLPGQLRHQAAHQWAPRDYDDIGGQTIGVVGMGPIGLEVIRLAEGLGMHPIGMRRAVAGDEPCETWTIDRVAELARLVDVLVLALPLTDDTRGIVSAAVLEGMKPGARLVNVGRGDLVDEPALVRALAGGHLGGAGLDVFTTEPLPADSPLWDLPNVIITPHSSALTAASGAGAVEIFLDNLARYVRGEPLRNER
ncbi:MAG: D-2-hydroxyacid dehydrogenase [Ilumatobacteraceae bacterium]